MMPDMIPPNADAGRSVGDAASSDLFQPVQVGHVTLANRIVMAPLTRSRAGAGDAARTRAARYTPAAMAAGMRAVYGSALAARMVQECAA